MAVADEAEGWAEAQRRIAVCRETQADRLDLGGLQLTCVPEEVYELGWLRRLYIGADAEGRSRISAMTEETKRDATRSARCPSLYAKDSRG